MKAQVESLGPVRTRLLVEVSPEEVAKEEELTYQTLRKTTSVPGFRKGKAPVSVLKRLYGERVRSDVISRLIETSYRETLEKEDISPVSDADIQLQSEAADGGLSYTAVFEIRPVVEPRGYKEMALRKEKIGVEESEVEARLESLRTARATFEPAPEGHTVEEGDLVVMDYQGTVGGQPFEGGTGEDRSVLVGSGLLVPGFEEGIKGMAAGQERSVEVEFPQDYRAKELAGENASFRVTVKEIKTRSLPAMDDEFAKEVGGADGVESLRNKVREALLSEKEAHADQSFRERTIDALLGANPFEVPESMVRAQQSHTLERMRSDLEQRGLEPQAAGLEEPQVQEAHRRAAERVMRWAFLSRAIAEAEQLSVSDEEVDDRIKKIAEADGRPYSLIRSFFEEENRMDSLRASLLESKVMERIVELGTVEEVEPEAIRGEANR